MTKQFTVNRVIAFFAASSISTFLLGPVIVSYYQVSAYRQALLPKSTIAVFVSGAGAVSSEVLKERLLNLEGAGEVTFVSREQALENAAGAHPAVTEILLSGDNPFSPYFIIHPRTVSASAVAALLDQVNGIEGVEDIRYDPNLVAVADKLLGFREFLRTAMGISLVAGAILWATRMFRRVFLRRFNAKNYALVLLSGAVGGAAGSLLFYCFSRSLFSASAMLMPERYFIYLGLTGIFMALVWEN
ncbi:MAG: cell division protein FtsX [Endomicrobiales bacterium]